MGALPVAKPQNLDQYGRDPNSPPERLRRRTDYKAGTGYAPLFHSMLVDLVRLTRGQSCTGLALMIFAHQERSKHSDLAGWTPSLTLEDWSQLAGCDAKEVQRNRDYLKARKMADCKVDTKRLYSFRLRVETWQALEDYRIWFAKQPKPKDETEDEPAADDPAQNDAAKGNWRMSKPVKVPRGQVSKPYSPDCGVARIRFQTPADTPDGVDIEYFSVVKAGDLIITPTVILTRGVEKAKSEAVKRVRSSPEDMDVLGVPASGGSGKKRTTGKEHPRAAELCKIFDPLLEKSGSRFLSFDSSALKAACEAIGKTDHDYLVHFVMGPGGRGERPITRPGHVAKILEECRRNWEKGAEVKPASPLSAKGQRVADNLRRIHGK